MIDDNGLARLASMAHALRPDWPSKSLLTYLHANHASRPYRDLAVALAWIAADTATQTPKRLEENGSWWAAVTADTPATTRTPIRAADMRCPKCGFWVVAGEPHTCQRRADPEAATNYATLARKAAEAGRTIARARANMPA